MKHAGHQQEKNQALAGVQFLATTSLFEGGERIFFIRSVGGRSLFHCRMILMAENHVSYRNVVKVKIIQILRLCI